MERDCSLVELWLVCVFSRGFWCCYLYFSKLKKLISDVQESYGWNISFVSSGTFKFTVKQVIYNVLFWSGFYMSCYLLHTQWF